VQCLAEGGLATVIYFWVYLYVNHQTPYLALVGTEGSEYGYVSIRAAMLSSPKSTIFNQLLQHN